MINRAEGALTYNPDSPITVNGPEQYDDVKIGPSFTRVDTPNKYLHWYEGIDSSLDPDGAGVTEVLLSRRWNDVRDDTGTAFDNPYDISNFGTPYWITLDLMDDGSYKVDEIYYGAVAPDPLSFHGRA